MKAPAFAYARPTSLRETYALLDEHRNICLTVNGTLVRRRVPVRKHLVDFLREDLGFTGTHLGCEHGVCGTCTRSPWRSPKASSIELRRHRAGARYGGDLRPDRGKRGRGENG